METLLEVMDLGLFVASILTFKIVKKMLTEKRVNPSPDRVSINTLLKSCVRSMKENTERTTTGLCKLIGYQTSNDKDYGVPTGIEAVRIAVNQLWKCKGNRAIHKENVPVMCVFATQGQGKTELCRSLVLSNKLHLELEDVDTIMCIHVSFNQFSTYSQADEEMGIEKALILRVVRTTTSCRNLPASDCEKLNSLQDLLQAIRQACCKTTDSSEANRVGILLAVDEILKVTVVEERRKLLDALASLQQDELLNSLPTFVLITSLNYQFVQTHYVTETKRYITPILLPTIMEESFENISDAIFADILMAATAGDEMRRKKVVGQGDLRRLINVAVWQSGRNFRSLEEVIKAIFTRVVSPTSRDAALKSKSSKLAAFPEYQSSSLASLNDLDNADVRRGLVEALSVPANGIMANIKKHDLYETALACFLSLIVCPNEYIDEADVLELQMSGGLFVRSRREGKVNEIVPRVNLAFLYTYALQTCGARSEWRMTENSCYLTTDRKKQLRYHIPLLINNIGAAINGTVYGLADSFEHVLPWIELVRMHAFHRKNSALHPPPVRLEAVLPDVIIALWDAHKDFILAAHSELHTLEAIPTGELKETRDELKQAQGNAEDATKRLLEFTLREKGNYWVITQPSITSKTKTKAVEYAATYFASYQEDDFGEIDVSSQTPILLVASVKLRDPSCVDILQELKKIHATCKACNLVEGSYYAVLYCCNSASKVPDPVFLPKGSIVVPIETLEKIFRPFGASCLLHIALKKSKKASS